MKKYFFSGFTFYVILLLSCQQQTAVKFKEPLPPGAENLASLPPRYTGKYFSNDSSSFILISPKQIFFRLESELTEHKDSMKNYYIIQRDSLIDKVTGEKFHFTINRDSVCWHYTSAFDTIFNINSGGLLRKFRGHYFLNTPLDSGYWKVQKLDISNGKLTIADILDSADIFRLQEITKSQNDTTYIFKPSKKQFRRYLRNDGFSSQAVFYRIKP